MKNWLVEQGFVRQFKFIEPFKQLNINFYQCHSKGSIPTTGYA